MDSQPTQLNQAVSSSEGVVETPAPSSPPLPTPVVASAVNAGKNDAKISKQAFTLPFFLGLTTWVLTLLLLLIFLPTEYWFAWRGLVARIVLQSAYIDVGDRVFTDNLYIVRQAKLAKPGYIALYEASEYESGLRDALSLTKPLFPGSYQFLQLHIDPEKWIGRAGSSRTHDTEFYLIMYYFDKDIVGVEDVENIQSSIAVDALGQPIISKLTVRK